ncbi:MAG: phosphate ABC transporter, permease protein PstA [Chloroflexi bacterium RBG_16_50_9]|nr:MAG: phosphate ABC transporter, permease protein PstA [Chloroflexi bacterium RBG_16_50_9]
MSEISYIRRKWLNRFMLGMSGIAAGFGILMLALILGYTLAHGIAYLNLDLLTQSAKPAGEIGGGIRNEIIGTFMLVALASLMAIPVGLMAGIFLSDFGNTRVASGVRFAADILAGVPSIVVGVFAYAIVVRPMHAYSALAGGVALAIIMVPVVARTAEESLRLVPNSMREAALALGITRWRAVVGVVIPGALTGIATGVLLSVARVAGETAPLIFTALGSFFGFQGLLQPIGALPLLIYNYALSPYSDQNQQAWAAAFLLVLMILGISILVRWVSRRRHT